MAFQTLMKVLLAYAQPHGCAKEVIGFEVLTAVAMKFSQRHPTFRRNIFPPSSA
jgi:hypothetical protein